jgi:hypothetical protein
MTRKVRSDKGKTRKTRVKPRSDKGLLRKPETKTIRVPVKFIPKTKKFLNNLFRNEKNS